MIANKLKIIFLICFCFTTLLVKSQRIKPNKPNIYFLIDTAKIPLNDRLYKINRTLKYTAFDILCPCFPKQQHPGFTTNQKPVMVSKADIKKYSFITLKDFLVKICKEKEGIEKNNNIFFVEKIKNKYYMYLVMMDAIVREE